MNTYFAHMTLLVAVHFLGILSVLQFLSNQMHMTDAIHTHSTTIPVLVYSSVVIVLLLR